MQASDCRTASSNTKAASVSANAPELSSRPAPLQIKPAKPFCKPYANQPAWLKEELQQGGIHILTNPPCKHMKPEPLLCVAPAPTPRHRFVQRRMVVCECQNPSRDLCRPRQAQCRCANLELLSRLARCQGRTCSGPVQMRKTGNVVAIGTFERPVTGPPAIELAQEIPAGPCTTHAI